MITSNSSYNLKTRKIIHQQKLLEENIRTFCKTNKTTCFVESLVTLVSLRDWEGTLSGLHWQQTHLAQTFGKQHPCGYQQFSNFIRWYFISFNVHIMFEQDTLLKLHDLL